MKSFGRGCTLEKALQLLKAFTLDKPGVTVPELSSRLNIGKSTAHRLVKSLLEEGILIKDSTTHLYRLSFSLLSFGNVVASQFHTNSEKVFNVLQSLVRKTGETGYIGTLHGTDIVYIQKVDSEHPIRLLSYLGKRNPVYCTSSGRSVLAYQSKEVVDAVIERGFQPYTDKTIKTASQLHGLLARVRLHGYDLSTDEFHKGVSSIGAPILDPKGKVRYSVNIVGPNQRITKDKIPQLIQYVMEASDKIATIMKQGEDTQIVAIMDEPERRTTLPFESRPKQTELHTVSNAIRILRLFTVSQPELGVGEISGLLNLSKTTTHRLISVLAEGGFLEKSPGTRQYRLGIELLTLSGIITTHAEIHREALPVLRWLVKELDETALIGVLEETEVNYLLKVECQNPIRLRSSAGRKHPAHCTGSGKVMLAYESSKVVGQLMNKGLPQYTSQTITDPVTFTQHLEEIRRTGYAVSIEEIYEGVVSIGLPIRDYSDKVVASLTIVGSKETITHDKISYCIEKAQLARDMISERLGYIRTASRPLSKC